MLTFMERMRVKYGRIYSFNIGTDPVVVLADYDLYIEAAQRDEFQGRPYLGAPFDNRYPDKDNQCRGIMFSNGEEWKELRRFSMR